MHPGQVERVHVAGGVHVDLVVQQCGEPGDGLRPRSQRPACFIRFGRSRHRPWSRSFGNDRPRPKESEMNTDVPSWPTTRSE
jgi:hypothetical protein